MNGIEKFLIGSSCAGVGLLISDFIHQLKINSSDLSLVGYVGLGLGVYTAIAIKLYDKGLNEDRENYEKSFYKNEEFNDKLHKESLERLSDKYKEVISRVSKVR